MNEKGGVGGWSMPPSFLEGNDPQASYPEAIRRQREAELHASVMRLQRQSELKAAANLILAILLQSAFTAMLLGAASVLAVGAIWIAHQ
jgi:hypothetical protein